jgi:hypothetical protein
MPITLVVRSSSRTNNHQEGTRYSRRVVILFLFVLSTELIQFRSKYSLSLYQLLLDTHRTSQYFKGFSVPPSDSTTTTGTPTVTTTTNSSSHASEAFSVSNVLLMGQFNQNPTSVQLVQDWVSVWSHYFSHIVVTGPFSLEMGHELEALGIAYRRSRDDAGWVTPYETLGDVARELHLANSLRTNDHHHHHLHNGTLFFPGIDAILSMHDDALLNISYILDRNDGVFPTNQFLWNGYDNEAMEEKFTYFVQVVQETWENGTIRTYPGDNERFFTDRVVRMENQQTSHSVIPREFPWTSTTATDSLFPFRVRYSNKFITSPFPEDDSSSNDDGYVVSTIDRYVKIAPDKRWPWIDWCMKRHLVMLVEGSREVLDPYAITVDERSIENQINGETVRSIQVSRQFKFLLNMQADFFLLPMEWADEFSRLAEVFATDDNFLESAVITMGRWMMSKHENKKDSTSGKGTDQKLRAQNIPLCTTWFKNRGKVAMIDTCLKQSAEGMGLYHPFKIGSVGIDEFKRLQAIVQRPAPEARMALAVTERRKP